MTHTRYALSSRSVCHGAYRSGHIEWFSHPPICIARCSTAGSTRTTHPSVRTRADICARGVDRSAETREPEFLFFSAFAQSLFRKNSLARQLQYLWRTDLVGTFTEGDRHVSFRRSVRFAQECHLLCSVHRDRERKSCSGCAWHSVAHGAREHHASVDMTCEQAAT